MMNVWCLVFLLLLCIVVSCASSIKDAQKAEILPPCKACKQLVESFEKGIERTSRFKFEGGDTDWEEKKQVRYADSEIRLTEIQEELCTDIIKGQNQCHKLASENDEHFEQWWTVDQKTNPDFYDWFCIQTLKVCCPRNTYGINCDPCPGGITTPCNNKGKCRGEGTRVGVGECRCNPGYTGTDCSQCLVGFYNETVGENEFACVECHQGCQGHCRDGTAKGCEVCAEGWLNHPEFGCQDIDECLYDEPVCHSDHFCVNTPGSFNCIACHKSCASCVGDAPNECKECKPEFTRHEDRCLDSNEWWRIMRANWGQYVTYFGLCVATLIVLKKSLILASILGVAVALYIGMSQYTLSSGTSPTTVSFIPSD